MLGDQRDQGFRPLVDALNIRNAPTKNTTTNKPTAVAPQPELRASKALPRLTLKLQQSVWFDAAASNKEQKDAEK